MIKENVLEIKKLVSDLHCMGTYGMVELELTKIENYIKELEGKVKNLTIPRVSGSLLLDEQNLSDEIEQAHKRYGSDNKEQIDAYIEGLQDGAKYYNVSEQ